MKLLAFLVALPLFVSSTCEAQSVESPPSERRQAENGGVTIGLETSRMLAVLPDAPVAKAPMSPCPAGVGKPCALLGGRPYLPDRLHLEEHDASWAKAMSTPLMIGGSSLLMGSFIADYKTTRYCIDRHVGKERNPLMGQSRAQELAVGIPATAVSIWAAGKLKEKGQGTVAALGLWAFTLMHTYFAYQNAETCGGY
jgi:hypothetical protein